MLPGPVRRRPVDDRLDRRQEILPERAEERVAPDLTLLRDQEPERRKPVLIDEMLERHRRGVDDMVDVMHPLGHGRIDAERMESRPILAGFDDRALRQRRREAPLVRNRRQLGCRVDRDRNSGPGSSLGAAQPTPQSLPRHADGLAPERVQRPADANEPFVFDAVARRRTLAVVQQANGPVPGAECRRLRPSGVLCPNAPAATSAAMRGQTPEAYPPRTRRLAATSSASAASG